MLARVSSHWRSLVAKRHSGNLEVVPKFGKRAERMLLDFANTLPEHAGLARFRANWERYGLKLGGNEANIFQLQGIVRAMWEGKKKDIEGVVVAQSLGLVGSDGGEEVTPPPIEVDWTGSSLLVAPRMLDDLIWLTLLQHSQRLGVCENHVNGGECPTPYFLKYRPQARFCGSQTCVITAQRKSKREWWAEHGPLWLETRRRQKSVRSRRSDQ